MSLVVREAGLQSLLVDFGRERSRALTGRASPPEHLVEDDARREDVRFRRGRAPFGDLGGPIARRRRAAHRAGKVAVAVRGDLDVGWIETSVDVPALVGVVEGAAKTFDDLELVGEGTILLQPVGESHS